MYLMFADEADQDGRREYLIYAAIFVAADAALEISQEVNEARIDAGMRVA